MAFDPDKATIMRAGADLKEGQLAERGRDGNLYPAGSLSEVKYWPLGALGPYHFEFQGFTSQRQNETAPGEEVSITWTVKPVGKVNKVKAPLITRLFYYLVYRWYLKYSGRKPPEITSPDKWDLISRAAKGG
jgi:hypothetical protein